MSIDAAEIEARIRSLSFEDKTKLLRTLIVELDGSADADAERVWSPHSRKSSSAGARRCSC